MKKLLLVFCLTSTFAIVGSAQSATVRREIRKQSCSDPSIKAVKIGPQKNGFLAMCARNSYEDNFLFEKTRLIHSGGGSVDFSKTSHSGYYDIVEISHSGAFTGIKTTYNWNGSSYVQSKCREYDMSGNGWRNPRPCS